MTRRSVVEQSISFSPTVRALTTNQQTEKMSALFNFQSLLSVLLLLICTCAYLRSLFPNFMDKRKTGLSGTAWKLARIGERKSPYVAVACVLMAVTLFWS